MIRAVFPGSFDPITNGHENIIRRAAALFDELTVGVLCNCSKACLFSVDEKIEMINDIIGDMGNVTVKSFDGSLIDFVHSENASVIVRGMRGVSDFEYESAWSQANRASSPDIEEVFFITDPEYSYMSSSVVKELARYNADISKFISPKIISRVTNKYNNPGGKANE